MESFPKREPPAKVAAVMEADRLARETDRQLLHSEMVEQAQVASLPARPSFGRLATRVARKSDARRLFIDVTHSLQPDLSAADEAFRVQYYVAQHLTRDSALSLDFVAYDRARYAYRLLSQEEGRNLECCPIERRKEQHGHELQTTLVERAGAVDHGASGAMNPIARDQRGLGAMILAVFRKLIEAAEKYATPSRTMRPVLNNDSPFQSGDVLLCTENLDEYMDYAYLARLSEETGVRIVSVVRNVTSMSLPFLIPEPAHRAHRHWVEIGHVSECLIATSHFSRESYDRFIAKPNDIEVPIHVAPLPDFLRTAAEEIEAAPLSELEGRTFAVYRSTIEARKNHILALQLWDELQRRLSPEKLPILVFVGQWGWGVESVRRLAKYNRRLRPFLRVFGQLSDAGTIWLYRNARFAIFPSLAEDSGHVAAESLSFGTPVVVSNCPALLEATEQLMPAFHPHDFMGWLNELERLAVDDTYLATLRQAAARYRGPAYEAFAAKIRDAISVSSNAQRRRTEAMPPGDTAP